MITADAFHQGGSEVVYLDPDLEGHTSWVAPETRPSQYVMEVAILTEAGAEFSVLAGGDQIHPFTVDQALVGLNLPKGSYPFRLSEITITSGKAIILLS